MKWFRVIPGLLLIFYFISLGVAIDDPYRDNLAIDRRYDLIHLCVNGEYGDFGIADLKMKIEEIPEVTNPILVQNVSQEKNSESRF